MGSRQWVKILTGLSWFIISVVVWKYKLPYTPQLFEMCEFKSLLGQRRNMREAVT